MLTQWFSIAVLQQVHWCATKQCSLDIKNFVWLFWLNFLAPKCKVAMIVGQKLRNY